MDETEQMTWVFDSLVGFLKGPVWNIPIMTFIEQKSIIFEPGEENDEEYKKIHEEYKNLVDFMLGSHMEDLGITPEQFEKACGKATENIHTQFHQSLFEQVWAADDFEIFKRMMTQKNVELQLQALELLAQKYGLVPDALIPENNFAPTKEEEAIMEEVIRLSLEEHENLKEQEEREAEEIEKAIQETLAEKSRLEGERLRERDLLDKAMKLSLREMLNPAEEEQAQEESEENSNQVEIIQPIVKTVNAEEMRKRQEYLRQQRDRLLALKRQEREKQLDQYEINNTNQNRPKTAARAAKSVVQQPEMTEHQIDPKTLAFRRSLAARLKAEVVGMIRQLILQRQNICSALRHLRPRLAQNGFAVCMDGICQTLTQLPSCKRHIRAI